MTATPPSPPATAVTPVQPPAAADAPPAQEQQQHQPEQPADPRLATLVAMFPDFDHSLLLSVLDSCDGDQDLAVDMLLEMSNPDYKATATQAPRRVSVARHFALTHFLQLVAVPERSRRGARTPPRCRGRICRCGSLAARRWPGTPAAQLSEQLWQSA